MSFKPRGALAACWKTRDWGTTHDNLLLVGPRGSSLRRLFLLCVYVCMPLPAHV